MAFVDQAAKLSFYFVTLSMCSKLSVFDALTNFHEIWYRMKVPCTKTKQHKHLIICNYSISISHVFQGGDHLLFEISTTLDSGSHEKQVLKVLRQ